MSLEIVSGVDKKAFYDVNNKLGWMLHTFKVFNVAS